MLKYAGRKCVSQIGSLQILISEKCRVSLKEIITVATTERITQRKDVYKLSCQNKYSIIQRMDECHFETTLKVIKCLK